LSGLARRRRPQCSLRVPARAAGKPRFRRGVGEIRCDAARTDSLPRGRASSHKAGDGVHAERVSKERSGMVEKTILALPQGKKVSVPRVFKRVIQVSLAVVLTAAVILFVVVSNGMLVGRAGSLQAGLNVWIAFIKRTDILATIVVTAVVTLLLVYWQRDRERK
jgi:hypothetical protein